MSDVREKIGRIADVRTNNNDLWMGILEIAARAAPDRTIMLLEGILANDLRVNVLLRDLITAMRQDLQDGP